MKGTILTPHRIKTFFLHLLAAFATCVGAAIAAFAILIFFIPNNLIDGGTVGLSMIAGRIWGQHFIPYFLFLFNLPFLFIAYKSIGRRFVLRIAFAVLAFCAALIILPQYFVMPFVGDTLEVVVIGGALLGIGIGLIIRFGGCLDGTEILGLVLSKRYGFTVGEVVLLCNILIFGSAGFVFGGWHPPLLSLITYLVVVKVMDTIIMGLDDTKSVLVISSKSHQISAQVLHELGLGLTIMYGRGGFSGHDTEILYIIAERLQLAKLKDLIYDIDPKAFVAIQNLHEVSAGKGGTKTFFHVHKRPHAFHTEAF